MAQFKELAIQLEAQAISRELVRDADMVKMALSLALRNTSILFNKIEANRGYTADCSALDDIEQNIQNLIDDIEGLRL